MKILSIAILALLPSALLAQLGDTLRPVSVIKSATVYFEGAEVLRAISLKAVKGRHVIELSNLPASLDPERIQVAAIDGLEILSVNSSRYQRLSPKAQQAKKNLEAELRSIEDESASIKNKSKAFDTEERLLLENMNLAKREGSVVADIRDASNFYRERLNDIYTRKMSLNLELRSLQDSLREVFQRINQVASAGSIPQSTVLITVECSKPIDGSMSLKYFVSAAGWEPTYDFRVDDTTKPLELVYNGRVFQTTGEDWKNVRLTFSSANPSVSGTSPKLDQWYINRPIIKNQPISISGAGMIKGKVTDTDTGEPLPFVNVLLKKGDEIFMGIATDIDGNYTLKPVVSGSYDLMVTYVGYQSMLQTNVEVKTGKITFLDVELETGSALNQFEIVEYQSPMVDKDGGASGARVRRKDIQGLQGVKAKPKAASVGGKDLRYDRELNEDYIYFNLGELPANYGEISSQIEFALTSTAISFIVDQAVTIPSDGKDQLISIKKESINAEYVYLATPKLDKDVFLVARLPKWSELQLLSGPSSIYYQGTYTGDAYIDSDQTTDTLEVSLGRDASIISQRIADKTINDKKILGSNIKQTVGWELTVRNNKALPIMVEIRDQYPLSELKSIEVEQLGHGDAELEKDKGFLTWTRRLEAGTTEKVKFSYSIKYPQGQITGQ